jgi:integral membrane protein
MENNTLKKFRLIARLEGFSWVLLISAMILKYVFKIELATKIAGWIHGILFISFCFFIQHFYFKYKWSLKKSFILFIAAWLPFATFWAEKKYLKDT